MMRWLHWWLRRMAPRQQKGPPATPAAPAPQVPPVPAAITVAVDVQTASESSAASTAPGPQGEANEAALRRAEQRLAELDWRVKMLEAQKAAVGRR